MAIFSKLVACSTFVKRQTPESSFSHYIKSWEALEQEVAHRLSQYPEVVKPGYRDGVLIVEMDPKDFMSGVVKLDRNSKLEASYSPRREGEASYLKVCCAGDKQQARYASVVLYRHNVLAEGNERSSGAKWEIVAIKAQVDIKPEPMCPMTMARNFLLMDGGTKGEFSAEDFAKSIVYWNCHSMVTPKKKWYDFILRALKCLNKECQEAGRRVFDNLPYGKY